MNYWVPENQRRSSPLEQKFDIKSFLLLALFISMMALARNEYFIIAERFVKTICESCIGI